ncbi:MAG TPA: sulfate ABC transporter substrate-binding protein [Blastocatellia bacterium]|nr:sulfate ABC transporter substrate-binding protein [Blastocatellia bacterium]
MRRITAIGVALLLLFEITCCRKPPQTGVDEATITVYGFSVVKEALETEIFPAFQKHWVEKTGQQVKFASSFAGSEIVTNQILSGVKADIAILAIERDAERLRKGGAVKSDWHELPHKGIVNRTPFVIAVRKGNPKGIHDFPDLAKPGVKVIHPDPISSGGAQWSLLAIYGSELMKSERQTGNRDSAKALDLIKRIWKNVIATPGSAREARTQFETGFGDALITYELEALQLDDRHEPFEIVVPSSTIFSEHPVVIVDRDISPTKRALVEVFASYLWSETAQRAWVKYHFRAVTDEKLNESEPRFARIAHPFKVADLGGWERAYPDIIEGVWKKQIQSAK